MAWFLRTPLIAVCLALASIASHASMLSGFDQLEKSLRLDAQQKEQFDVAVAATQRALLSIAFGGLQMKERIAAELAKPRPDLNAIARAQEEVVEQSAPLFRDARLEWARLYATLDPAQVAATKAFVEEKLERLERLGDAVREMLSDRPRR